MLIIFNLTLCPGSGPGERPGCGKLGGSEWGDGFSIKSGNVWSSPSMGDGRWAGDETSAVHLHTRN